MNLFTRYDYGNLKFVSEILVKVLGLGLAGSG